jgi:sugar phosphate isomerase/epimerase
MERREFVQTLGAAAFTASVGRVIPRTKSEGSAVDALKPPPRIGLELYAVRTSMSRNVDATLAAVRAIGYTEVESLWSFGNWGRSPKDWRATLDANGLRSPSAHMEADTILVGWERSLERAKIIGHEYLFVPSFDGWTSQTIDDWKEWADKFNAAGAVARKYGVWLGFHNEANHMPPIDGQIPYDVFMDRVDPTVTRHQLDVGNMMVGKGDPVAYYQKYRDKYWSFHLKDVLPDRSGDTYLGQGIFDFKSFLKSVPDLALKPAYIEHESPADDLDAARRNYNYLHSLDIS